MSTNREVSNENLEFVNPKAFSELINLQEL